MANHTNYTELMAGEPDHLLSLSKSRMIPAHSAERAKSSCQKQPVNPIRLLQKDSA